MSVISRQIIAQVLPILTSFVLKFPPFFSFLSETKGFHKTYYGVSSNYVASAAIHRIQMYCSCWKQLWNDSFVMNLTLLCDKSFGIFISSYCLNLTFLGTNHLAMLPFPSYLPDVPRVIFLFVF